MHVVPTGKVFNHWQIKLFMTLSYMVVQMFSVHNLMIHLILYLKPHHGLSLELSSKESGSCSHYAQFRTQHATLWKLHKKSSHQNVSLSAFCG